MTSRALCTDKIVEFHATIGPSLTPALHQLDEWVGGWPETTIGANPNHAHRTEPSDHDNADNGLPRPDWARRTVARIDDTLERCAHLAETAHADLSGELVTFAASRKARKAALAYLCRPRQLATLTNKQIGLLTRDMEWLHDTVQRAAPAKVQRDAEPVARCKTHAAAGDPHVPAHESYKRDELCRWCGRFKGSHGIFPPRAIVRLHDRGIRITPAVLRQHGVKVAS